VELVPVLSLPELSVPALIGLQARHRSAKLAVDDGRSQATYGQLWEMVSRFCATLRAAEVQPGAPVAFALPAGTEYVAGVIGAMAAGAVAVPLNVRLTSDEVEAFVAPIAPAIFVTSDEFDHLVPSGGGSRRRAQILGTPLSVTKMRAREEPPVANAALLLGTGGSTGLPKAAVFSSEALWRWTIGCAANNFVRADDIEMFVAPFYHGTLVTGLLTTLTQGGTVVVADRFDAERTIAEIGSGRITRLLGAATVVQRLVGAAEGVDMNRSSLRFLQFGMSSSRQGFANDIRAAFPGTSVITGYGTTEFGPVTRAYSWEFDEHGDPIGVGHPVPGASILVLTEGAAHSEPGVEGELLVRSPWQMFGYCSRDPDLESEAWWGDHMRSGDIGRFDVDGNILLTGRLKDIIRTGGETVYPSEVESALYRFPAVAECSVYGVPDETWGERVEAAVVTTALVTAADLESHLRTMLAGYKVPKAIRFMDALPQTSAHKIDRRALQAIAAGGGER
jgi:fatty-acyl-CoA synthase